MHAEFLSQEGPEKEKILGCNMVVSEAGGVMSWQNVQGTIGVKGVYVCNQGVKTG